MYKMQSILYHLSAVCCCLLVIVQALPSGLSGHSGHGSLGLEHQLVGVPDLNDFAGITYPKLDVIDLGETQKYVPETQIKVVRTIKITQPYPVKVPVKVPYPVTVVKEVPVEVTKVVKVPEPVHIDVVKSVESHSSLSSEHVHGSGSADAIQEQPWQHSASGFEDSGHAETAQLSSDGYGQEYQPNYHSGQEEHQ